MSSLEVSHEFQIKDDHKGVKLYWVLKMSPSYLGKVPMVTCAACNGNCRGHVGFGYMDDPVDCYKCHNTGRVEDPSFYLNYGDGPRPPQELLKRLEKVWKDYWNEQQNEEFKLT